MAAKNKPNELYITRVYNAPVKLVWEAFTDPKHSAHWWGPRGFSITSHHKELRPGGTWKYTMHGPDGTDYPNIATYHEVEPCARLVYDHGATETTPPLFRVTVNFSEKNGRTTMDMTMALATPEAAKEIKKFVKMAGGNSTWDRFAEYLDKQTVGKDRFVINRCFVAPIDKLFQMWTDPEHVAKWLPPVGFKMNFLRADIRPGASSFYSMTSDDGAMTMYGRCHYIEIKSPDRIVYTQEFTDQKENVSRHPGAPTWPASMLTTITLVAENASETRVTVEWEPHGPATAEEIACFVKERGGMTMGWTGSFNKLDELLGTEGF